MRHRALLQIAWVLAFAPAWPADAPAAVPTDALFRTPALSWVAVNPSGSRIAALVAHRRTNALQVQRTDTAWTDTILRTRHDLQFHWVDDDSLLVRFGETSHSLLELSPGELDTTAREEKVRIDGWLVDPLPLVEDTVLWATWTGRVSSVYRLPTAELVRPTGDRQPHLAARLREHVLFWISDFHGVPRAALVLEGVDPIERSLRYRESAGSRWRTVGSWGEGDEFPRPVGVAPDGHDLLVLSSEGRGTTALRRYDVDEKSLGDVIFANPNFDVTGVVPGYQGDEVVAVTYQELGLRRYHHLNPFGAAQQSALDRLFPDKIVHLTGGTKDARFFTALVDAATDPGRYFLVDTRGGEPMDLGAVMPWVDPTRLAPVRVLQVEAHDGARLEAFLTLPKTGSRPPLIVMPHGGPLGVSDARTFDPYVQSFAAHGYAVLQVNYRGSGGRGVDFLEAGRGAWGTGIEDDIEAVLDHVVASGEVDPARLCIFGGSYGGYSALISITRRPQRYRCAVAAAAPTDLLLMFESSDFAATAEGRREFARIVGDPDEDREHLISISPAYRAADMQVPVLLIHGDQDRRVDLEHAYRMKEMLEVHGKPHEWALLRDTTHWPTRRQARDMMDRVLLFVERHLGKR